MSLVDPRAGSDLAPGQPDKCHLI
uniref:Uncharacterized protein n=1 Tax=mine drainage metagenome TaxID=410659 RepID=E6QNF7_9ZZZZ